MRSALTVLIIATIAAAAVGCANGPGPVNPPTVKDPRTDQTIVTWPFWPKKMRIHPLSRFATNSRTGERVLEIRIEFTDRYGDTCKCVGEVRVKLFDADDPEGGEVLNWYLDLGNLHDNETYYDEVTRTYLLRVILDTDEQVLPSRALVQVFYLSMRNEKLDARLVLDME